MFLVGRVESCTRDDCRHSRQRVSSILASLADDSTKLTHRNGVRLNISIVFGFSRWPDRIVASCSRDNCRHRRWRVSCDRWSLHSSPLPSGCSIE